MGTKVRNRTSEKLQIRSKRRSRIRGNLSGSVERPRLCIFRSNTGIYVQVVDDTNGATLVAASSRDEEAGGVRGKKNIEAAKAVGVLVAKRALAKNISQVVFDRSGYLYHGRIRAVADAAREAGLKF